MQRSLQQSTGTRRPTSAQSSPHQAARELTRSSWSAHGVGGGGGAGGAGSVAAVGGGSSIYNPPVYPTVGGNNHNSVSSSGYHHHQPPQTHALAELALAQQVRRNSVKFVNGESSSLPLQDEACNGVVGNLERVGSGDAPVM